MRHPSAASPLTLRCLTSLLLLGALGAGCGGASPPAKAPDGAATSGSGESPTTSATPSAPTDASGSDATPASAAAASASPASPASTPSSNGTLGATTYSASTENPTRIEDMKIIKTTSTGGHYGLMVQSASGVASDDVGRALGESVSKTDACYAKLFSKKQGSKGKTSFEVTISLKGKTETIKLGADEVQNKDLVKCLEGVLKGVDWPVPNDIYGGKTSFYWIVEGN